MDGVIREALPTRLPELGSSLDTPRWIGLTKVFAHIPRGQFSRP